MAKKTTTTQKKKTKKNVSRKIAKPGVLQKEKSKSKAVVAEVVDQDSRNFAENFSAQENIQPDQAYRIPQSEETTDIEILEDKNLLQSTESKKLPTTTSRDPLSLYLAEIRKYPLLTKEQEAALAKKYFESKDPESAQALVKANLRFVVKIAAEYSKFGAKMIDLIQEGNVGLMHAVKEYNPYKGARLITYAVWWIRGYIQDYLMKHYSIVRIGTTQNQRKLFYQLQKEKDALDALGVEPNVSLLSSRLGIPEDEVTQMAQRMSGRDVSLDKPIDDESGQLFGDLQKNSDETLDEKLAREEMLEILTKKIEEIRPTLNEKEKIILEERLLNDEPLTLQEIGEKYKITREAVRQAEARLMKKIKDKMEQGK